MQRGFSEFFPPPRKHPKGNWSFSYEESLQELDLFSLEKTEEGLSLKHVNISRAGDKSLGPDSSAVPISRIRCSSHKLNHKKFHISVRNNFPTLRVAERWNRRPGEIVESPSLETFHPHQDAFQCNLL